MMHIRLDVETISTAALQSSREQIALKDKFVSSLAGVDQRLARVEEMLRVQADQLQADQFKQVGPLYSMPTARRRRAPPSANYNSTKSPRSEGLGVRVTPYTV